ncbi:MAG: alpha/beta fold hydrolase [Pyrinomonadaceae bacterium]
MKSCPTISCFVRAIDKPIDEDWDYMAYVDVSPLLFSDLDYLVRRIGHIDKKFQIIATAREPEKDEIDSFSDARFEFKGFDLVDDALVPRSLSLLIRGLFFMLEPPQFVVSRYLLGEKPPIDLVETFRQANLSVPPDVLAFRMRSVLNVDVRRAFAACHLPILYLFATQDRLVKRRSLAQMLKINPQMTVV